MGEKVRVGGSPGVDLPELGCCGPNPAAIAAVSAFIAVVRLDAGEISPSLGRACKPNSVVAMLGD